MVRLITKEEVKKHNTNRSIWIIIHNQVYDVTKFLDEHPGGADSLMDYAGQDGTQAFEDVGHSDDAREMMKQYRIGKLPPAEHTKTINSCGNVSQIGIKDCLVCHQTSRPKPPKSEFKTPTTPRAERRVQTIVVPRESSKLKWAIFALGAAIIIGVVMKKYMT